MPARKPAALSKRHSTKRERSARVAAESATTPKTFLPKQPPAELKAHKLATATWKRLVELYGETEGTLITAFDADLLTKYCLAEEELQELSEIRAEIKAQWATHRKFLKKFKPNADNIGEYVAALGQLNALLSRFKDFDARLDGKRKFLHDVGKSMYLTPRSRAGVAPTAKEPEKPKSEMGQVLDD
jgi:phage terminase small subunit